MQHALLLRSFEFCPFWTHSVSKLPPSRRKQWMIFPSCLKDDSTSAKPSRLLHSSLLEIHRSMPAPPSGVMEGLIFPCLDIFPLCSLVQIICLLYHKRSHLSEMLFLLCMGVPFPGKPLLLCTWGVYISSPYMPMTPCPPVPLLCSTVISLGDMLF